MPLLLQGKSVLIASPTASGKTEAAFAPLYQRHVSFGRSDVSVVYVAPTKALVNDMRERLLAYFGDAPIESIQRYTGDHHEFHASRGGFVLLATPEALDSLQLVLPEALRSVRAVILDEIHLLHGTARGQQLRSVVARVRARSIAPKDKRDDFQIVAMTATVHDLAEVSRCWLGEEAFIVDNGAPRPIEMVYLPRPERGLVASLAQQVRSSKHCKVLMFCNTRNAAHELAAGLHHELAGDHCPVFLHIGLLSKDERERVENALRRERKWICVATSTLEVGVDVGDIDVVVLCQPPLSVGEFMQRIGRGNRRSERSIVWAQACDDREERLYQALLRCARTGTLDDQHEYERYSVEFQQILSLAWAGVRSGAPLTVDNIEGRVGRSIDAALLSDMRATGALADSRGALIPNDNLMDIGDARRIHSVIAGGGRSLQLVDSRSGDVLGAVAEMAIDDVIYTGDRFHMIHARDGGGVYVAGADKRAAGLAKLPATRGTRRGLSRQVAWALAELDGFDPSIWKYDHGRLLTWGGVQYNGLLAIVLRTTGRFDSLQSDEYCCRGAGPFASVTPTFVELLVIEIEKSGGISARAAASFRTSSAFFESLGAALQQEEIRRSVPWHGFKRWLRACSRNSESIRQPERKENEGTE